VINHEKHEDYIHTWDEFVFYEGAKEAIAVFSKYSTISLWLPIKGELKGPDKLSDVELYS
jgi:hypothetical protein